jgi:hypothetical protein
LGVTGVTIRNDLAQLEKKNILIRARGGAIKVDQKYLDEDYPLSDNMFRTFVINAVLPHSAFHDKCGIFAYFTFRNCSLADDFVPLSNLVIEDRPTSMIISRNQCQF